MSEPMQEPVTNPKLVATLNQFMSDHQVQYERAFMSELREARFLVPIIMKEKLPQADEGGSVTLKKGTTIQFVTIENREQQRVIPAFTDWAEVGKYTTEKIQTLVVQIDELEKMIEGSAGDIFGFVINPATQSFINTLDNIRYVKNNTMKINAGEEVQLGIPANYPQGMVDHLVKELPHLKAVHTVWLLLMRRGEEESYLLVVDFSGEEKAILFPQIAAIARKDIAKDSFVDLVPFSSDFGKNAVKEYTPIYTQKKKKLFSFFKK